MTDGLPRAPWRAPEPPRRTSSRAFVAIVVLTIVLPLVAMVGLVGWVFYAYASHDRIELIEHPQTVGALERPCAEMTAAGAVVDLEGPPAAQAESLLAFVAVARVIPDAVAALDAGLVDDDLPTADWGRDWATLLDSIEVYAHSLESGGPATFLMPQTPDGYPIDR